MFLRFENRFGEESLHACEVMLKDVEDSKRANNGVHSELKKVLCFALLDVKCEWSRVHCCIYLIASRDQNGIVIFSVPCVYLETGEGKQQQQQ